MTHDLERRLEDALSSEARRSADLPPVDTVFERAAVQARRNRRVQAGAGLLAVLALAALVSTASLPGSQRGPTVSLAPGPAASPAEGDRSVPSAGGSWESVPPAPIEAAYAAQAVSLGGARVLVVGGITERAEHSQDRGQRVVAQAALYDLADRRWSELPELPFALETVEARNASVVRATSAGDGTAIAWRDPSLWPFEFEAALLDPRSNTWIATGPAPLSPRTSPTVEWVGDRLLVWGGYDSTSVVESLEGPSTDELLERVPLGGVPLTDGAVWTPQQGWTQIAAFPLEPRHGAATGVVDEMFAVWGGAVDGRGGPSGLFDDGALYDPARDTWAELPPSGLAARSHARLAPTEDGFVVAGGFACDGRHCDELDQTPETMLADAAAYDIGASAWTMLPPPPSGAQGLQLDGLDRIQTVGAESHVWDGQASEWTASGRVPAPEAGQTALRLGEALVVLPAAHEAGAPLAADLYHGDGRRESLPVAPTEARQGAAATAVDDAALFVWGGFAGDFDERHIYRDGAAWTP